MMSALASWSQCHIAVANLLQWQQDLAEHGWHWVESHGYVALFALLFASGMGLPVPEDVPIIAAGVQIARGAMTWYIAGPVAWVAMICGDTALYIIGFIVGLEVVRLPVIGCHISEKRLGWCRKWFDRWGVWAIGIGRMFAGIRSAMVVAAGTMRFNYLKLLAADGIAATISGGAFMLLGYWAGLHSGPVKPFIEKYRDVFTYVALAAALVLIIVLWIRAKRKAEALALTKPVSESLKHESLKQVVHHAEPT
jgi:membrane protein DedA with SNARE-associated domain